MALQNTSVVGILSNSPRVRATRTLKQWIADGRLPAGERLPAETKLAQKLNISRSTMRLAIESLVKEGLITVDRRRRLVLQNLKPEHTFLSDAVALIADRPGKISVEYKGNWHSRSIQAAATDAAKESGFHALSIQSDLVTGDLVQRLINERPRGVMIMREILQTESGRHLALSFKEGNIPFVVYGDHGLVQDKKAAPDYDTVISDHEAGSYQLTQWLISQGRKRILRAWSFRTAVQDGRPEWLMRRDRGYERAMREAGLEILPAIEIHEPSYIDETRPQEETFAMLTRLMAGYLVEHLNGDKAVDAILAASDSVVPPIAEALRVHGKAPNRDVLLAGYDNMGEEITVPAGKFFRPAVTMDKKNHEIGRALMALLLDRIQGKLPAEPQHRVVKPTLIVPHADTLRPS